MTSDDQGAKPIKVRRDLVKPGGLQFGHVEANLLIELSIAFICWQVEIDSLHQRGEYSYQCVIVKLSISVPCGEVLLVTRLQFSRHRKLGVGDVHHYHV